jgi:hypothetical protein
LCGAFFIVLLDGTITIVALPSIGVGLHFSEQGLHGCWAYTRSASAACCCSEGERLTCSGASGCSRQVSWSAAGPLAIHLARHGRIEFGEEIEIRQGAEIGRPSVLHARVNGSSAGIESVEVGGAAVIVARGEFCRW